MDNKMTWEEMKNIFPDEWLLITDFTLDQSGHLISGAVTRHSVDKDEVYRLPAIDKPSAFKYTGESTFNGTGKPMGVSEYQLTHALPENLKSSLPSIEEIESELGG